MRIKSFEELEVWQKAHELTLLVYKLTQKFPREERFGLAAQWRRAASSIAANIAEGFGRRSPQDKTRFYNISQGSTEELKYLLILSRDLGYVRDTEDLWLILEDVSRMLRRLTQATLRNS